MDVIVQWDDGTFNTVLLSDIIPKLEPNAKGSWVHDISWTCKIIHMVDENSILVEWADTTQNIIAVEDIQACESSDLILWKHDQKWTGRIMNKGNKNSHGTSNIQFRSTDRYIAVVPPDD